MELAEPPLAPTPGRLPFDHNGDRGVTSRLSSWTSQHNLLLTIATASAAPILYLLFINRYAVNSFNSDDWSVVPLVHAALHGHLTLSLLWGQHHESRLFIGNVIDVLFGFADRLDLRSVILFNALLFIASYAVLLVLVRKYLGRRLTPIPVLVIGVTWFSLADVQNALWAFQVSWYLTVVFFVLMLCVLLVPDGRRTLWFALAVVVAVLASLSTVQGFLCWPLGAICLLWQTPRVRELVSWLGAMVVTMALYLPGYSLKAGNKCRIQTQCTSHFELHHLLTCLGFYFALLGNVVPGETTGVIPTVADPARYVVLGTVIFGVALIILIQSWRHRTSSERLPLPALMIAFALLFDITIALGRGGSGVAGAVNGNRFVMANLILLTGIVIYGLARIPRHLIPVARDVRGYGTRLALFALALFLVIQVTISTGFGVTNGRSTSSYERHVADVLVNLDSSGLDKSLTPYCLIYLAFVSFEGDPATLRDVAADHLGEFNPDPYRSYRELGWRIPPGCQRPATTSGVSSS